MSIRESRLCDEVLNTPYVCPHPAYITCPICKHDRCADHCGARKVHINLSLDYSDSNAAPNAAPEDIQNTLTEFTASACITGVTSYAKDSKQLIVCGGGAFNSYLLKRLQAGLAGVRVSTSDAHGLPALQVEAAAFAWLARRTVQREAGNLPGVTGAKGLRVLGAIYPAWPSA